MAPIDEANDPRLGTVVDEYRIVRLLGFGGMGRVYLAEHTAHGTRHAIKLILPQNATNREAVRRFQNEAKSAGHLQHPNVAAVNDVGTTAEGLPYLVMELLVGLDCGQLLASTGPLKIERACDIVHQACLGLAVAHQQGIVHRDIKPQNLFVTQAADGSDLVKVLDFGTAKLRVSVANLAATSAVTADTLYYLAPEQVRDAGKADGRADVWAIGAVLYELLTGCRPFDGSAAKSVARQIAYESPEPPNELRPELPTELISALDLALEKDPEKRFHNVAAMADSIAPFTGRPMTRRSHLASSQRPPSPTPVDATYDPALAIASELSNAPLTRTLAAGRERMHRVYSLLVFAALVGFTGGWLTRRLVNHTRVITAAPAAYPVAQAPGVDSASQNALAGDSAKLIAAPALPVASDAITAVTTASASAQVPRGAPLRLVRASADAGTLRAIADVPRDLPGDAHSNELEAKALPLAAKRSSPALPPTERVPEKPKAIDHPPAATKAIELPSAAVNADEPL